jgi:hypothetical protein
MLRVEMLAHKLLLERGHVWDEMDIDDLDLRAARGKCVAHPERLVERLVQHQPLLFVKPVGERHVF